MQVVDDQSMIFPAIDEIESSFGKSYVDADPRTAAETLEEFDLLNDDQVRLPFMFILVQSLVLVDHKATGMVYIWLSLSQSWLFGDRGDFDEELVHLNGHTCDWILHYVERNAEEGLLDHRFLTNTSVFRRRQRHGTQTGDGCPTLVSVGCGSSAALALPLSQ